MTHEWIEQIAAEIKRKNAEAAETFSREQHAAAVIAEKGKPFFVSTVQSLQQNVDSLRAQLQGDITASDIGMQTVRACEVKVTRARFPCVDATLEHHGETITLDYAKAPGTSVEQAERKQSTYTFRVGPEDTVYVQDAFAAEHAAFRDPESLAQHLTELLFTP